MLRKGLMFAGLLLALAGCDQKSGQADAPRHFTPPALWRVEVVEDSGGQTGVVQVCANPELISSFTRVEPRVNGQPCQTYGKVAKDDADEHIERCAAGGLRYGLYVTTQRRSADDFTVRFALQPLQAAGGKVVQARRYQRIGDCPSGWKAGDQGKPGGAPTSSLLSGQGPG
ncbi:hypothetical protein [Caulobacter sp. RL271]|jgi:hypothetical protein|uniref:Lipoprotein n=1 Tax=Caulobacter segnis TaxID=88688 RepID=A0ABY4ZXQ6_9CAUL|nr:hypothetical protein [Caulobacter segnis]USQ97515.1 hypothetical protein MZV50_08250 [Caulobacter segnis]